MDIINIYSMEDVKNLSLEGFFHLKIYLTGVEINLKNIYGNCTVKAKGVTLPLLEKVDGSCYFMEEGIKAPKLKKVKGGLHLKNENNGLKNLKEVGGLFINSTGDLIFNSLEKINGHLVDLGSNLQVPKLTIIKKDAVLRNKLFAPFLEIVEGKLYLLNGLDQPLPNLKYVYRFLSKKIDDEKFATLFPSLKRIKEHYFKRYNSFIDKIVDTPLYPLRGFIINRLGESYIYHLKEYQMTFDQVVSILKLEHKTFDDFFKEEFSKQWCRLFPSERLLTVGNQIKKHWDITPKYNLDDFLKTGSHFMPNLSRYLNLNTIFELFRSRKIDSITLNLRYKNSDQNINQNVIEKQTNIDVHVIKVPPDLNRDIRQFICLSPFNGNRSPDNLKEYNLYAIKQWSNKSQVENWRVIGYEYIGNPLDSLLSTFIIDENKVPKIERMHWNKYGARYLIDKTWDHVHITNLASNPRPITRKEFLNWIEVHE